MKFLVCCTSCSAPVTPLGSAWYSFLPAGPVDALRSEVSGLQANSHTLLEAIKVTSLPASGSLAALCLHIDGNQIVCCNLLSYASASNPGLSTPANLIGLAHSFGLALPMIAMMVKMVSLLGYSSSC